MTALEEKQPECTCPDAYSFGHEPGCPWLEWRGLRRAEEEGGKPGGQAVATPGNVERYPLAPANGYIPNAPTAAVSSGGGASQRSLGCDDSSPAPRKSLPPSENKFHSGSGADGKHYWLTPPDLMADLQQEFQFTFDACPYPKPDDFDGLTCEWGASTYANIPFGSIIHEGRKKGPTAWMRKAIAESRKGKRVVVVYPVDKWILMMLAAGAVVRNLGDVRWCATEDGSQGKGTGRHIAAFILEGAVAEPTATLPAAERGGRNETAQGYSRELNEPGSDK